MRISIIRPVVVASSQQPVFKSSHSKSVLSKDELSLSQSITKIKEQHKSTELRGILLKKEHSSSSLIRDKIAKDEVNVFIPQAAAAKYEPDYLRQPIDFEPKVLKFKVDQYNEISFEYTGDFIYIPLRSETTHEE